MPADSAKPLSPAFSGTASILDVLVDEAMDAASYGGTAVTQRERDFIQESAETLVELDTATARRKAGNAEDRATLDLSDDGRKFVAMKLVQESLVRRSAPLAPPGAGVLTSVGYTSPIANDIDALTTGVRGGARVFGNGPSQNALTAIENDMPAYVTNIASTRLGANKARQNIKALDRLIEALKAYPDNETAQDWTDRALVLRGSLTAALPAA